MAACKESASEVCQEFNIFFEQNLWAGKGWFRETDDKLRKAFPGGSGCLFPISGGCLQGLPSELPGRPQLNCAQINVEQLHEKLASIADSVAKWVSSVTSVAECLQRRHHNRKCARQSARLAVELRRRSFLVSSYHPADGLPPGKNAKRICKWYRRWVSVFIRWTEALCKWENMLVSCTGCPDEGALEQDDRLKVLQITPVRCPDWEKDETGACPKKDDDEDFDQ